MGLLHIFNIIFIWPVLLLLRGITSPLITIGQLLCWVLYHRRRVSPTPASHGDDSLINNGDNDIIIPGQTDRSFNNGDNLKFRNRLATSPLSAKGLKNEFVRGGGPLLSSSMDSGNNLRSISVPKDLPVCFYAINLPQKSLEATESPQLVFQEKGTVLKEIKKYKGARFKSFPTEQEAIDYAKYIPEPFCTPVKICGFQNEDTAGNSPHPAMMEKSNWKAPKGHELLKLRKSIEAGEFQAVLDMINSNPRFLISCGDTPSILQEGPRYNALHFAAKYNQPDIIRLWFQTIEHPSFFVKLYGQSQDNEDARNVRVQKLLDLYLNTPDKGPCETPLHFASKFGHRDAVEVLMSHPLTEANPRNKFGETPADLICHRVDKPSNQLVREIREFLEGRRYVPLYRAEDNIVSPTVGTPCSPVFSTDVFSPPFAVQQMNPFSPEALTGSPKSPHSPHALVKAFAGPMSPSEADRFRKLWRSPCSRNDVVREDHDKGYERLGRDLALQNNVLWSEYWQFLDRFTDLSKPEGIQLLETHLQKQSLALNVQSSLEAIQHSANRHPSPKMISSSNRLQTMKKALFSDGSDNEDRPEDIGNQDFGESPPLVFSSLQSEPQSQNPLLNQMEEMDVCPSLENGTEIPNNQYGSPEQKEKELSFREENLEEIINTLTRDFCTKLCIMSPENTPDNRSIETTNLDIVPEVNSSMNCLFSSKNEFTDMLNAAQDQEPLSVSFTTQASCDKPTFPCLSPQLHASASPQNSSAAGTVLLNVISPTSLVAQIKGMPAKSPPKLRNPLKVFIQGSVPSKVDRDVLRVVKNVPLDYEQFPYTARWLKLINSFSEIEQKIWPSPAKAHGMEFKFKDGTPVKARAVSRLEPLALFKSPGTMT